MASKRRGGFRPPELRGTLGTLLRTTTGVVRDALQRGAREGRARLDDVRASRRRQDALADLGDLVLDLIRSGEIDLAELPEARDLVRLLDEFDTEPSDPDPEPRRLSSRHRFDDRPPRRSPSDTDTDRPRPRRDTDLDDARASRDPNIDDDPPRRRPDDDPPRRRPDDDQPRRRPDDTRPRDDARPRRETDRGFRPADTPSASPRRDTDDARPRHDTDDARPRHDTDDARPRRETHRGYRPADTPTTPLRRDTDSNRLHRDTQPDGTVSSGLSDRDLAALADRSVRPTAPARTKPSDSASSRVPTKPIKSIWRPQIDDAPPIPDTPESRHAPPPFRDPNRKGGITFDDEDLDEYMHPDDVPAKSDAPNAPAPSASTSSTAPDGPNPEPPTPPRDPGDSDA